MELPINVPELEAAATGRSPGLDGLPKTVMPLVGPALADALNTMLQRGELTPSLRRGAVRLMPKVTGSPSPSQLCPITSLA
jgi:hypothetical protein